ncbi:Ankyrin repeat protein [Stieleria neptunia]|uniref:Ankyrin repeat protein n=1 Tax=Stieleria neptunia TaxID=2527979 RepID=A0A518HNE4_9BACT|nr:ankyrin repeat domain-containing protein [Stieleria neptunia]QDV42368.1 Ankyrin repeat protein [Stieleria neptunia]
MIRIKTLSQSLSALAFLALLAVAVPLSASPPTPVSSSIETSGSPSLAGTQVDAHDSLYRQLCDLNENWANRTPDFEILNEAISMDSDVSLIQTHLQLVISQLQSADVSHLSDSQLEQRSAHLRTLQTYMQDGRFPLNVLASDRRPVFIDPWGTHCAVGHLIATSGNTPLADTINREHQLDFLRDIKTEGLSQWQHASGLSLDELALIQPTYRSTTLKYPKEIEALILGDSAAIVSGIESGELKVDARCGGKTLLHFAAAAGDLALVKLLVDRGADLHAVSNLGCDTTELAKGGRQTVVTVRWNQSTAVTNRGGMGIGIYGTVYRTERGKLIASLFNDVRGGRAGLDALDYATETPSHNGYNRVRYIHPIRPGYGSKAKVTSSSFDGLQKDRAAVAAWLEEQGLKAE